MESHKEITKVSFIFVFQPRAEKQHQYYLYDTVLSRWSHIFVKQ